MLSANSREQYNAVVNESLRLSTVSTRLMRVSLIADLVFRPVFYANKYPTEFAIPAGYSISMSPMFLNQDPHLLSGWRSLSA